MADRVFCVIIVTVLSISALVITSTNIPPKVLALSTPTITLIGITSAWNNTSVPNPTITVTQGDVLTIQLIGGDTSTHRFFVDADKNGITPDCPGPDVCSNNFPPSTSIPFSITFAPGTYTYYCEFHPSSMLGKFVVLTSVATGGAGVGHALAR
jgi:plastocyanin